MFGLYFAADVFEVTMLNLDRDYEARFGQDFKFKFSRDTYVLKLMLNRDSEIEV